MWNFFSLFFLRNWIYSALKTMHWSVCLSTKSFFIFWSLISNHFPAATEILDQVNIPPPPPPQIGLTWSEKIFDQFSCLYHFWQHFYHLYCKLMISMKILGHCSIYPKGFIAETNYVVQLTFMVQMSIEKFSLIPDINFEHFSR